MVCIPVQEQILQEIKNETKKKLTYCVIVQSERTLLVLRSGFGWNQFTDNSVQVHHLHIAFDTDDMHERHPQ